MTGQQAFGSRFIQIWRPIQAESLEMPADNRHVESAVAPQRRLRHRIRRHI